jgi:polysaccharide deacetylase family protein (PEP-CTERM system associated)
MKKYAVLTLDVEDWYHLDYFSSIEVSKSYSMLDGLTNFLEIVDEFHIKSTLFTLSDVVSVVKSDLLSAIDEGHEVASHGMSHKRPLTISKDAFIKDIEYSKKNIEDSLSVEVLGYRAPCFSINNNLLEALKNTGHQYDSSMINFGSHPLYGCINPNSFIKIMDNIYQDGTFTEFELPTTNLFSRNIPISGGGYLRIFPWHVMKILISNYLFSHQTYFLYIHPFELSNKSPLSVDTAGVLNNFRFRYGQGRTPNKLIKLIKLLKANGYEFVTFKSLLNTANNNLVV